MFRNYLKIAVRNLLRHKGFSFINIAGLTLGLTACLLIGLFVRDEKQFDQFIPQGDQIFRIYNVRTSQEGAENNAGTPPMFATTLQQEYPEVAETLRILRIPSKDLFEANAKKLYEEGGIAPDSTFFNFFPLTFTYGTPLQALDDPASMVLSQKMAERFFGPENPVGKTILFNKEAFTIKGVFQSNPKFHLAINFIVPLASQQIPKERMTRWTWQQFYSYVKLKKGVDAQAIETKFQSLVKEKVHPILKEGGSTYLPYFQPLKQVHLYSADFKFDLLTIKGNHTYVNALSLVAVFILLIACFNFVNLATAKSLQRAKEVGVRKAIGASRRQLMEQFIGETLLLTFISVVVSGILTLFALPGLNEFTGKQITFNFFTQPQWLLFLGALTGVVGILAGFYPALVLSGFQPVKVLKGTVVTDSVPGQIPWLRHGLVVVQFALSVLLIISALVVSNQVEYLHQKDLGFNREEIMFFPMRGDHLNQNYEAFKNELLQLPGVSAVSIGYGFPGDMFAGDEILVPRNGENTAVAVTQLLIDHDYVKTLGLDVIAGRDFSKQIKSDATAAYMINETAVASLGLGTPQKALGQPLLWQTWANPDSLKKGKIIGVVKDFHYKSLYDKVEPAVLQIYPDAYWKVAVKIKTAGIDHTIGRVKEVWNRFSPEYPLEFNFLNENFNQMYQADDKLQSLLSLFTLVTIFVACLGLFGLAAFAAERRRKEVGIRKVLGASVKEIAFLLSKEFIKLVGVALVVASPVAWYFMEKWLQDFAYRITLSWEVFVTAGLLALFIAGITVGFQAVKAATVNPVDSLRSE
ncbi:ABC transporter permease [Adhaeribacter pallidiroseus]|uniref:Macrolide export ATP-binding/permease protein MacB n=1 Tax=Adhaeribacter pallidiroseus TaxID=2072847 RepID=A0A369QKW9_9BACT|nr:ABC transporter permease [Adhaeribacter pallidiroseus]RDC65563.1 Macrolide export ATP-binding/permease protein MacB [Adhaeribacter pallidiroseus]